METRVGKNDAVAGAHAALAREDFSDACKNTSIEHHHCCKADEVGGAVLSGAPGGASQAAAAFAHANRTNDDYHSYVTGFEVFAPAGVCTREFEAVQRGLSCALQPCVRAPADQK